MADPQAARHRLIDAVLSQATSGDAAVGSIPIQALLTSFSAALTTLIGYHGVQALYDRALEKTSSRYAWLAHAQGEPASESLAGLQEVLKERSAQETREVVSVLLIELTDILATLIGESLTDRLMRRAWNLQAQDHSTSETRK